jgi:predicted Zn-dependent protease
LCRPHGPVVIYRDAAPAPAPPPPTPAQAAALVAAGRLDAAAELLATLARTAPQDPEVWTLRARLERKQQRLAAARQAAARALRIEPGHPGALAEQGLIALASGDADGARAALAALDAGCGGCPEAAALRSALTGAGHVGSGTGAKRLRVAP